jgi:PAS domain S-box-containing protein
VSDLTSRIISTSPFPFAHHRIITNDRGVPVDYEILEVNPAFEELIGLPADKLAGKRAGDVLADTALFHPARLKLFGKVALDGPPDSFEYQAKPCNRWFRVQTWSDGEGYFTTLHTDITDKKTLEKKNEERKKELKVVYDMARISERDDTSVDSICQAIAEHLPGAFQFPESTCCKISIGDREYRSTNYSDAGWSIDRHINVSGKITGSITVGYLGELSDGNDRPFLKEEKQLLDVVADWTGQFIHRKQSESQLVEANTIINRSATVVFTWQNAPGWPVSYVSDNVANIIGYIPGEFLSGSINYLDCIHPDDAKRIANEVEFHSKHGKNEFVHEPYRVITKDGEIKWVYDWTFIVRDGDGTITHYKGFIHDITRHKLAEDALKDSQYLLSMASSMVRFGGWSVDLKENKVIWSDMVARIHEQPPEYNPTVDEAIGYYAPEWRDRISKAFQDCALRGITYDEELEVITAKGNRRWVRTTGQAVKNGQGRIVKVQGAFQDITDRKLSEQKLRESEERFRNIFEIASLGIAQVDPQNGEILLVNKYYEEITGYSIRELLAMKFPELTHPDDRAADWEIFQRAARGETTYRNEKRYIRKDGSIVWVRLHVAFIRDDSGRPMRTVAICENIAERKKAEELAHQASQQLAFHIQNSPLAVVEWDERFRVKTWSSRAENLFGWTAEEVVGKAPEEWSIVDEDDRAAVSGIMSDLIEGRKPRNLSRNRNYTKDGRTLHCEWYNSAMFDSHGNLISIFSLVHDITDRIQQERALRRSLEEKTTLLQELYHRTKNNMQVISSMLMIHALRSDDEQFTSLTHDINNRIKSMSLVHQKLYETNNLSSIPFDEYLRDLFTELSASFLIQPGQVTLKLDADSLKLIIDTAIPCGLVLNELISNSFKHAYPDNRKGTITIKARKCKDSNIHIQYRDDGIGMPPGFDQKKDGGMGWELIRMIVEYQLGGSVTCMDQNGMACDIHFTDNKYSERVKG